MTKNREWAAGLLALMLVVGTVEAAAQSIRDFPCQIDLGERIGTVDAFQIEGIPEDLRRSYGSDRTQKVCQGRQNIRVSCDAFIRDWPFGERLATSDLTCCINAAPCGMDNVVGEEPNPPCGKLSEAGTVSLRINATRSSLCGPDSESCGMARLECRLR